MPEEPAKPATIDRSGLLSGTRPEIANKIILTSADGFDGYEIMRYIGMVWGISVRAKDMGQDFAMGCKQITGGELTSYSALADESRQRALDRLPEMARRQGANAVINVRFDLENANVGAAQVVAHGTAVFIRPIKNYVPSGGVGNILADIHDEIARRNHPNP